MFAIGHGIPREEIIKDKLPADFPTSAQKLKWVAGRIEKYFPITCNGVLEMVCVVVGNVDRQTIIGSQPDHLTFYERRENSASSGWGASMRFPTGTPKA